MFDMNQFDHRTAAASVVFLLAALLPASAQVPSRSAKSQERLVPGNYGDLNDTQGNRWNIQQSGNMSAAVVIRFLTAAPNCTLTIRSSTIIRTR